MARQFDVKRQLCAGSFIFPRLAYAGCGDSGGPLLASDSNSWVQMGILSWRYKVPYPDVFVRVSAYLDWIRAASASLVAEGVNGLANVRTY
mmetsp:Transcript_58025/g.135160  ORF Transcript_58025/g.135160 Transcript_58025/m.135160 type:complete len:91 (+) Transcript_58025:634-906(+)